MLGGSGLNFQSDYIASPIIIVTYSALDLH